MSQNPNQDLQLYPAVVGTISEDAVHSAFLGRELGADILEIRYDLILGDLMSKFDEKMVKKECVSMIRKIRETGLPIIATFRSKSEGGQMDLSVRDQFKWIHFITPHVDFVDLEWSSPKSKIKKSVELAQKSQTQVIISSHYFDKMPSQKAMVKMLTGSQKAGADISKIAVSPKNEADVLKLFEAGLASQDAEANVCLIAMGGPFRYSRIIAPVFGSVLSYGYITAPVAPGQLRVDEVKNGFRSLNLRS
ncbi:3-dehydroquinate dehydratase [Methanosarcinaceae archaeon Ag5]|uniref:3-dehydroquinate dehydratase n=1 Tax=Methanolapillus africanus TaxID=3028297 RepID=A0AAE4SCT9_9EURY|nr:3-dehydroquinate dehydratase [Methanosarcinaceae archaeon Ag5]